MSDNREDENVTNNEKPKDPKKVLWGRKLGQANKGRKKTSTEVNPSEIHYYPFFFIGGISIAAFVWYYTRNAGQVNKTEVAQQSKPKTKQNLEI